MLFVFIIIIITIMIGTQTKKFCIARNFSGSFEFQLFNEDSSLIFIWPPFTLANHNQTRVKINSSFYSRNRTLNHFLVFAKMKFLINIHLILSIPKFSLNVPPFYETATFFL